MREVIEDPVVPAQVTEHVVMARVCPICQSRCVPNLSLDDMVMNQPYGQSSSVTKEVHHCFFANPIVALYCHCFGQKIR